MAALESGSDSVELYDDLARAALAEGEEEAAIAKLLPAAKRSGHALLWQWAGLLQRSIDEHEAAIVSLGRAAALAPADASIAHAAARATLEAGVDAVDLFLRAQALDPGDGDVALGLAAARNALGDGETAAAELDTLLDRAPAWTTGHEQLAQLRSTIGQRSRATESLERALGQFPREESLWTTLFRIDIQAEDFEAVERDVKRAEAAGLNSRVLALYRAIAAAELDHSPFPRDLFEVPREFEEQLSLWRIRHLLRVGAVDEACVLIDHELASVRASSAWPYAALAWRLREDARSDWLEGDPRFVRQFDLTAALPPLDTLADELRKLHIAKGEYVDQSVRGGTQTDGPLLSRVNPVIRQLRQAIVGAVETFIAELPGSDSYHPLLSRRRDRRVRFAGSWSVRLRSGGRHANHVHPQGWISSALYVALPERTAGDSEDAGWLTIGQPQDQLGLDLDPRTKIEPRPGLLVLFPSWMWHGTVPFAGGERLTVAFDVRPPI
jgi:tetratricopeptide (TPR) repeat protein